MCGIIAIFGRNNIITELYDGLLSLQHRGQDAAGICTYNTKFHLVKGTGLVQNIFSQEHINKLRGDIGIGQTRYPTIGSNDAANAQPFFVNSPFGIALAHNGNVTNFEALEAELFSKDHRHINSTCDAEIILNVFASGLKYKSEDFFENVCSAVQTVFDRVRGAYSVVSIVAGKGFVAFRDPYGIRPIMYGTRQSKEGLEYCFASESATLRILGFERVRDLYPGEVIYIDNERNLTSKIIDQKGHSPCIFELIYFARVDSLLDNVSVYKTRFRFGEELAKEWQKTGLIPDVIMPVPDSSRPAAQSMAYDMNVKYREALVKNRYIGRTFIMPGQSERTKNIKRKLTPIDLEISGRNVLIVDDSIVRGNTSRQIIEMVRTAGAKKVFFASSCPPIKYPCVYGIDMVRRKEFIATDKTVAEIEKEIHADKLVYQTIEGLERSARAGNPNIKKFCMACLDGKYPTKDIDDEVLRRMGDERTSAKTD